MEHIEGPKPARELPSDLKQIIDDITPTFVENLNRSFRNEAIRLQSKNIQRFIHELDDVHVSIENTKIELTKLRFPWIPDFRIISMTSNLPMACLDLELNLGNLKVEGEYEANNTLLRKWLPVSHIGKITFVFNNVRAKGKVGLVMEEDSFVTQNYDIQYTPSDVTVRVGYHIDDEIKIENEISNPDIETTLGKTTWPEVTEKLSHLLDRQLCESIVEFSVTELLIDRDAEYREYYKDQGNRANKLLDSLLCSAKDYLVANELRSISTPPFDVIYKGRVSSEQHGEFKTKNGFLGDLATLTRTDSFSLFEDKEKLTVYGSITLADFKFGYQNYETRYEGNEIQGTIKGAAYKNKIYLKVVVKKEGEQCSTILENVTVTTVSDIDIDTYGLASLSWLDNKVKSWTIGALRQQTFPVLEKYVREAFQNAINRSDCVALLD